jgi:hypothetical protein
MEGFLNESAIGLSEIGLIFRIMHLQAILSKVVVLGPRRVDAIL